ncbi:glutathione S-transferase family protein [Aliikangiella sp. G2MR2-5]|uniref:glutathione S-transferase family protein n=1 Tax=Aliikangiella sp. G2MR2-5 TaxID=2788943 RepID=UPI0018A9953F|nr:glutathione S-transferase family protein [Aliikangiella sp. G2MR2-5]
MTETTANTANQILDEALKLYSFGYTDRSGKVRWLAEELGISVEEHKVEVGDNRKPEYKQINPFGAIPTAIYRGETLTESTATCIHLAEMFPEKGMAVFAKEKERYEYLRWISMSAESMEGKLVDYILASYGIMPEELKGIFQQLLEFKCRAFAQQLPEEGFLVANRLTVADIVTAYSLKLGILNGFIQYEQVEGYLGPLMQRKAAAKAHFFDGLKAFLEKSVSN